MARPAVSFVVPVRNDARRLQRCLDAIRHATPARLNVEIVVADNGSTDDSAAVAERAGARVLSLPGLRVGDLRNRAAGAAEGAVLAFVDADNEIGPEWIAAALQILGHAGVSAAGAPYHPPTPATWVQRLYDRLRRHPAGDEAVEWLGSGNLAIVGHVFRAVGGFDARLETCEDVDLCRKLRAAGHGLVATKRMASVHHGDPRTLGQVFLGELWRGRDNVRVSLRRPWSARSLVSAAIPVVGLAAAIVAAIGPLTGSSSGFVMSAVAIGVLATLVALRAAVMTGADASEWPRAMAVAAAYEAGRALALAGRFGYQRRRRAAAA